ncbi:MAG TPA: hypothetical protein VFQ75_06960 [Candidatus Limnocylindrales bacterium]|nr:hypothetical protein [Candidatus Limnocylindrales bacterium]
MLIYELIVFPVDGPLTADEAAAAIEKLAGGWQIGLRRDHRLDAFEARIEEAFPGILKADEAHRPFEFDAMRHHVFVGIPWESAEMVGAIVAEAAWSTGVAVFDPDRHLVGLPAPMADAPLSVEGIKDLMVATRDEGEAGAN